MVVTWNRWRNRTEDGGDTPRPMGELWLTVPQCNVLRTATSEMTELVGRFVSRAQSRDVGRIADLRQAQDSFVSSPATSYDAGMLLGWYGEPCSRSDGEGYVIAKKNLFFLLRAFTIAMTATETRNDAFELRILIYLSAIADCWNQSRLWAWIERGEGFSTDPPVLDAFRTQLDRYISEHVASNTDAAAAY